MDQQIIFEPNNRSTGLITTWAVERIPRELGLTCNTGPERITTEIEKYGGPVGLGYGVISLVKYRRVVVTLTVVVTKESVTLMLPWKGSCYSVYLVLLYYKGLFKKGIVTHSRDSLVYWVYVEFVNLKIYLMDKIWRRKQYWEKYSKTAIHHIKRFSEALCIMKNNKSALYDKGLFLKKNKASCIVHFSFHK